MVAGYDRYFQIARCFRDEDLRADRQPEFTQIDIEASFVGAEDVQAVIEQVLVDLWAEAGQTIARPFRRLSYRDAMERYGVRQARPALRLRDPGPDAARGGGRRAVRPRRPSTAVAGCAASWRAGQADAEPQGARRPRRRGQGRRRRRAHLGQAHRGGLGRAGGQGHRRGHARQRSAARPATCCSPSPAPTRVTSPGAARRAHGAAPGGPASTPSEPHAFCWVVDFPLFEQDPATGAVVAAHHPFTAPHPDDAARLRIRAVDVPRAALRRRLQRQRARQRLHPDHRLRSCRRRIFELLGIPAPRHPPPVRVPARRPRRRRAAARRVRARLRPDRRCCSPAPPRSAT